MNIIKVFTNLESIKYVLKLMLTYPFDERPLVYLQYRKAPNNPYIRGTIVRTDIIDGYDTIIIKNVHTSEEEWVFIKGIMQLCIFNEKAK